MKPYDYRQSVKEDFGSTLIRLAEIQKVQRIIENEIRKETYFFADSNDLFTKYGSAMIEGTVGNYEVKNVTYKGSIITDPNKTYKFISKPEIQEFVANQLAKHIVKNGIKI